MSGNEIHAGEIYVSSSRGQSPEFNTIHFPGGRIVAGEFADKIEQGQLPSGMSEGMKKEVLSDYHVQSTLRRLGVSTRNFT